MPVLLKDLMQLNSEATKEICEQITAAELSLEEMIAIAHELDKISSGWAQYRFEEAQN